MKSRLFHLKWDNSIQRRNIKFVHMQPIYAECEGVQFAVGLVVLDSGVMFENMFEMEEHFKTIGVMQLQYQNEEQHAN